MDEKQAAAAAAGASTTTKQERRQSSTRYLKLNRLPALSEVLDRRTRAPLDLFCFYIFLQRENAEDALDFWLDVQQHENLCKAYFKDLRRSRRSIKEDWPEFSEYARTNGSHFAPLLSVPENEPVIEDERAFSPYSDHPVSSSGHHGTLDMSSKKYQTPSTVHRSTGGDELSASMQGTSVVSPPDFSDRVTTTTGTHSTPMAQFGVQPTESGATGDMGTASRMSMKARWADRKSKAPTIIARDRAIEKNALVESAERIYLRYLLPGAEKEIYLPPSLRLASFPISADTASPLIPDLFHLQKTHIFRQLEQDAFPRFLRAKAFCNLTPMGSFVHLVAGLFVLWGAFVLGFSLIFLDHRPKRDRLWIILPFFVSLNLLLSAYYSLSPLLALFRQSETTPFHLIRVREQYVRKLISWRALWIEALAIVLTAVLTLIFALVPGKRL